MNNLRENAVLVDEPSLQRSLVDHHGQCSFKQDARKSAVRAFGPSEFQTCYETRR